MIAVVGGAGYIGSHMVKYLHERDESIVVFDNFSTGHMELLPPAVKVVRGDLASLDDLRALFSQYPMIDSVIHFAAFAYVGESVMDPSKYYRNNLANTINLLDVMLETGVKHLVFSSTCATYGNPVSLPITEEHSQQPINPYGRTKLMMEQMIEDYAVAYGFKFAALRYFNAAGAAPDGTIGEWHEPETHLIPLIMDVAIGKRESIHVFGSDFNTFDGTCIRDYIHVMDLADAHFKALNYLKHDVQNLKLNLSNGQGYSNLQIIKEIENITNLKVNYVMANRRPGDPEKLIGCADKAKQIIGWEPSYDLHEIIETAWNWHEAKFGGSL
ncbi:UDP-glucose 4-epimerase GalE [Paenibacillus sp. DXFW5]|uniref:UDP-glucose 4-epimerase n=1 Tax=Paenibacillus rhizolycopersici TaxID=2780073 RepID=A0ABS2HCG6_9BACL|nr:UDP-glucose 4-epimerase GalE [Paenibacillus rhizolycopersici]MBM6997264.1 UDP-glucose 4-epimerase GalE [Paenibacillus rhizolycopersici]